MATPPKRVNAGNRPTPTPRVINAGDRDVEREQLNRILAEFDSRVNEVAEREAGLRGEDGEAGADGEDGADGEGVIGKHAIPIMAGSIAPSVTGGCASLEGTATGSNLPDIWALAFDPTTQEYAQFSIIMPSSWDEGTITFKPVWTHGATTTNFGVVWSLQAVAIANDDAIGTAFGTIQTSTDTGGTTYDLYNGPESSAITVAGTPGAGDTVFFRISRETGEAGDTLAVDALLLGITLFITTDAGTDS